jgi:beta-glucosidase
MGTSSYYCRRPDVRLTPRRKQFIYQVTEDAGRTAYYMSYLGEVLKGIVDDGIPIKGTFAWSLVDNFEWNSGFSSESRR